MAADRLGESLTAEEWFMSLVLSSICRSEKFLWAARSSVTAAPLHVDS